MPSPERIPQDTTTRPQHAALLVLTVVLVLLGMWTLHEFLPALVWAGIIAIAIWPLYRRALIRFPPGPHNLLMPALFTLCIALLFLLPLTLVAVQFARESHDLFLWIDTVRTTGVPPPAWLSRLPVGAGPATEWWTNYLGNPAGSAELLHRLGRTNVFTATRQFGAQLVHRVVLFAITLMSLFFVLRDGESLARQMQSAGQRAFGPAGERIAGQIVAAVHGTVNGLVLVGLGEGLVLGIVYALAGVPHPTSFGVLTSLAAMIPFGAAILFIVAALLLLVNGAVVGAIAVFVSGVVVTFVADHFVRPVLIGGATRLPFLWVLLGILGGVAVWGLFGLFFGPALMAALMLLWREWVDE